MGIGSSEHRNSGTSEQRNIGNKFHHGDTEKIGASGHRVIGSSGHRVIGTAKTNLTTETRRHGENNFLRILAVESSLRSSALSRVKRDICVHPRKSAARLLLFRSPDDPMTR